MKILTAIACATAALAGTAGAAATVSWADLDSASSTTVSGTIALAGGNVDVTFDGPVYFAQLGDSTDVDYWTEDKPAPYTSGSVDNAPPTTDIIAIATGGAKTITFSRTVSDVYLALVSWNGNAGTFDQPFEVISEGCGYWGCGTFQDVTPFTFTSPDELHGIIRFTGSFDSISFTDNGETWHGIQIGIGGLPATGGGVPEPATWAMMIAGIGLVGFLLRRPNAILWQNTARS